LVVLPPPLPDTVYVMVTSTGEAGVAPAAVSVHTPFAATLVVISVASDDMQDAVPRIAAPEANVGVMVRVKPLPSAPVAEMATEVTAFGSIVRVMVCVTVLLAANVVVNPVPLAATLRVIVTAVEVTAVPARVIVQIPVAWSTATVASAVLLLAQA